MKFLIISQYFYPEPGAAQARLAGIAGELVRLGHQVEIVTSLPNYPQGRIYPQYRGRLYVKETWNGNLIYRVWVYASVGSGLGRLLNYLSFALMSLIALLRASRPDYVFVESPPLTLGPLGILAARVWRARVVFNVADLWPDTARDFGLLKPGLVFSVLSRLERWCYRNSDYVCAVTEGIRKALQGQKGIPKNQLLFLPNGTDAALYRPMPEDAELKKSVGLDGKSVLLYPGTQGYAHAAENLIYAAHLLQETPVHFVFLGGGSAKPDLIALADSLGLKNVTFLSPVPAQEIPRWLSIACCGLVSVRNSPILDGARPAKMFAIMACGKPVIYAGSGEGARLLSDAKAGIVVPPNEPAAIAEAIRTVVEDPTLAAELGSNGACFVRQNLGWERLVSEWLSQLHPSALRTRPEPQVMRAS